jgi:hypothetical protein
LPGLANHNAKRFLLDADWSGFSRDSVTVAKMLIRG